MSVDLIFGHELKINRWFLGSRMAAAHAEKKTVVVFWSVLSQAFALGGLERASAIVFRGPGMSLMFWKQTCQ